MNRERAQHTENTEPGQESRRLSFLARAGEILSYSLDVHTTLRRLARLAVPAFADWCAVDLVQADGTLERVAVSHVDPSQVELAYELSRRYPPPPDASSGTPAVLRTGQPEIYAEITDEMIEASARDPEHLALLQRIKLRSLVIVPLKARLPREQSVLGTLTLATAESGRHFDEEDLALAGDLAQRAALAVDNARLYGEATRLNQELEERVASRTQALREANEQLQRQIDQARQAEARFRNLLEAAPDPIIIVDESGAIVLANAQAVTVFGYDREELLGSRVERLLPAAYREDHRELRVHYLEEPLTRSMGAGLELEALDSEGKAFPVEVSLSPLETDEGLRVIAVVRDISARKQTEASMRRNEALYRLIAHHIPNGAILVVDQEMRYRLADGPSLRRGGYGEFEGKTPWDVLPPDLAERRVAAYQAALSGEAVVSQMKMDGRTYRQHTVPLPGEDGSIEAALVLTQDITDLITAEDTNRRLLRLSAKLHSTLDIEVLLDILTEEAIQLTRATGGFAGLNTARGLWTRHFFHEGKKYLVDKTWQPGEGIPGRLPQNKEPYMTNNTLADDDVSAFAGRFGVRSLICTPVLNREGELLGFFEVANKEGDAPFTGEDREKLIAVSQIAAIGIENAQAYTQMRQLSREIVSAQEQERRRLSRDLHDSAGQLLTALKLNVALLAQQQEESSLREQLEELEELADQTHQEIRATSQALRPPALEMVGLDQTLHSLCEDFGKQTSLAITYEGQEVPSLPDQAGISFYRFLQEALANVARHAQATSVTVRLSRSNGGIRLLVEDDGVGISLPHRRYAGTDSGVGLLGLRERFELIGGWVRVDSAPGRGTRVTSHYPLPDEEE